MHKMSMLFMSSVLVVGSSFGMELELPNGHIIERKIVNEFGYGSFNFCEEAIKNNPDIVYRWCESATGDLCSLLHVVVEAKHTAIAHLLLDAKALINAPTTINKYTPLHMARTKEMVRLLVACGADLDRKDKRGETPLCHWLFNWQQGYNHINNTLNIDQRCGLAHYFLKRKRVDIDASVDNRGNTLLHRAVGGQRAEIVTFLLENGASVNSKNVEGLTPLEVGLFNWGRRNNEIKAFETCCIAVVTGRAWSVDEPGHDFVELLKDGAKKFKTIMSSDSTEYSDYDKSRIENMLANVFMVVNRSTNPCSVKERIIKYDYVHILNNASFADLKEWVGRDAIEHVKKHLDERCREALHADDKQLRSIITLYPFVLAYDQRIALMLLERVMMSGDSEFFNYVLSKSPDLNGKKIGDYFCDTLLHMAIEYKRAEAIALLIKYNINLTAVNRFSRQTAIALLYEIGDKYCIDAFYKAFADMFFATYSYQPHYQEIKKLLKLPYFDINYCDKYGKTLLHKAVESHPEKVSFLLRNGAVVTQGMVLASSKQMRALLLKK